MYSIYRYSLCLREYIGKYRLDEILESREQIADYAFQKLKEKEENFYVRFYDAGVKDIILPGEIRDIMNTVLIAEKKAQANVIARREEVASTRSLLNTAKLMDENQTLFKLKELESSYAIGRDFTMLSNKGSSSGQKVLASKDIAFITSFFCSMRDMEYSRYS